MMEEGRKRNKARCRWPWHGWHQLRVNIQMRVDGESKEKSRINEISQSAFYITIDIPLDLY